MNMRSLAAHASAGAFLALALALVSLAFASGHSTAYARPLRFESTVLGHATVDGQPAPPAGCAIGDSWCAFCTTAPAAQACQAFPPAHTSGQTTSAPVSMSGNNPVPGVTQGGLNPGGTLNRAVGSFWIACSTIYGGGTLWSLTSLPPPPGAIC